MNAKEPFDLAKMAITLLLICLVLGATVGFFFILYDKTDEKIDAMEKATTSAAMERLYELEQEYLSNADNPDAFPLVTNVVSAITEFEEHELLYVTIKTGNNTEDIHTYTYTGVALGGVSNDPHRSNTPVTFACKELLQYSDKRCTVDLEQYDTATGTLVDNGGLTGVLIQIWY